MADAKGTAMDQADGADLSSLRSNRRVILISVLCALQLDHSREIKEWIFMAAGIAELFDQFSANDSIHIQSAAEALRSGDIPALDRTIKDVRRTPAARLVTNLISASSGHCAEMLDVSAAKFGSNFLGGMISVGIGGGILAEFGQVVAGITVVVGSATVASVLVAIVAVCFILWGISKAYPALVDRALQLLTSRVTANSAFDAH